MPEFNLRPIGGLALEFFRPSLYNVTTLHLDQTKRISVHYPQFRELLSRTASLVNLSIIGDIIGPELWSNVDGTIELHSLRSLRIYSPTGQMYNGLLICLIAPRLDSLVLKGAHEQDLDPFWHSQFALKFSLLRSLTFYDFDLPEWTWKHMLKSFPDLEHFTLFNPSFCAPKILSVLINNGNYFSSHSMPVPWPRLQTLSVNSDFDDQFLIRDAVESRIACGHSISRLLLITSEDLSDIQGFEWLQQNVDIEVASYPPLWPEGREYVDVDDYLTLQ